MWRSKSELLRQCLLCSGPSLTSRLALDEPPNLSGPDRTAGEHCTYLRVVVLGPSELGTSQCLVTHTKGAGLVVGLVVGLDPRNI